MISGIYKITNNINGKIYIGCSKDIDKRWKAHLNGRKNRKHLIHHAIIKHGIDNFTFEVLLNCPNICFDYWEKYHIAKYDCVVPNGYNLTHGGRYNVVVSEKTKELLSISNKGKKLSEETKRKIGENSKKLRHSEEQKLLWSEQRKGKSSPAMSKTMGENSNAKKIKYNEKIYGCKKELYLELGISKPTFRKRFSQGLYGIEL